VAGFCECGDDPSSSVKCGEFPEFSTLTTAILKIMVMFTDSNDDVISVLRGVCKLHVSNFFLKVINIHTVVLVQCLLKQIRFTGSVEGI
jgi:hypothetical protein